MVEDLGHVFFDEIHAYEDYRNIKVHTSGGGKKKNFRITYITTDGDVRDGVIDDYKKEAKDVYTGVIKNSRTLFFICKLDNEKEVEDPKNWIKANPSLITFKDLMNTMLSEHQKALRRPSLFHEFMTKRMNIPHQDETRVVAKWEDIVATNQPLPELESEPCIGGLDYASVRDFCGVGLLFKKDGKKIWKSHTFINRNSPHLALVKKEVIKEADSKGEITWISTPTIPPEIVAEWFINQMSKYNIIAIAIDKVKANYFIEAFENVGLTLRTSSNKTGEIVIVRSGEFTDTMVYGVLEDWFSNHNLIFGDSTLMRWYVNNTAVEPRKNGNKAFIKIEQQSRKNDGFMALTHATSIQSELKETKKIDKEYLETFLRAY
jgi:phage terminase large subunit-like protein